MVASFWSLDLQWGQFLSLGAARSMVRFLGAFFPHATSPEFLCKVAVGAWETLAMSALGTVLAAAAGLLRAPLASRLHDEDPAYARAGTRLLLNALRATPKLVWAGLLLIAAGLGPFAGKLALALHTTGVLGRLFAEALENAPPGPVLPSVCRAARPCTAQRLQGVGKLRVFLLYATLPQVLPQLMSTPCTAGKTTSAPQPSWAWCAGRRPGAVAGLSLGPVPHGQDGHAAGRHAAAGGGGGHADLRHAALEDALNG